MKTIPLTQDAYRNYGDVISARSDVKPGKANMGTADRYNFLGSLENLRPDSAKANLCVFDCQPMIAVKQNQFEIKLLERHLLSTQVFIPMPGADRFLVVVCLGKDRPDLSTLRVFLAQGAQGMSYKPGVWHHPLIVIEKKSQFACIVWENETAEDCETLKLDPAVFVHTASVSTLS